MFIALTEKQRKKGFFVAFNRVATMQHRLYCYYFRIYQFLEQNVCSTYVYESRMSWLWLQRDVHTNVQYNN